VPSNSLLYAFNSTASVSNFVSKDICSPALNESLMTDSYYIFMTGLLALAILVLI